MQYFGPDGSVYLPVDTFVKLIDGSTVPAIRLYEERRSTNNLDPSKAERPERTGRVNSIF